MIRVERLFAGSPSNFTQRCSFPCTDQKDRVPWERVANLADGEEFQYYEHGKEAKIWKTHKTCQKNSVFNADRSDKDLLAEGKIRTISRVGVTGLTRNEGTRGRIETHDGTRDKMDRRCKWMQVNTREMHWEHKGRYEKTHKEALEEPTGLSWMNIEWTGRGGAGVVGSHAKLCRLLVRKMGPS